MDVEGLICAVEQHPALWDTAHEEYKDKIQKNNAWSAVCSVVFPEYATWSEKDQKIQLQEVVSKWRTVRDNYVRNLKKQKESGRSGSRAQRVRRYIYADQLSFLQRTMEPRPTASSMDPLPSCSQDAAPTTPSTTPSLTGDPEPSEGESEAQGDGPEPESLAGAAAAAAAPRIPPARRRKAPTLEQAIVRFMQSHEPQAHPEPPPQPQPRQLWPEEDQDVAFLYSILPQLRQMSVEEKNTFRMDAMRSICAIMARRKHPPDSHPPGPPRSYPPHYNPPGPPRSYPPGTPHYNPPGPPHSGPQPPASSQSSASSEFYAGFLSGSLEHDVPDYEDL